MSGDQTINLSFAIYQRVKGACDALTGSVQTELGAYIKTKQAADGGYCGRGRESDLYYTLFAAAVQLALGTKVPTKQVGTFLNTHESRWDDLDFVHRCCLLRTRNILHFSKVPDFLKKTMDSAARLQRFLPGHPAGRLESIRTAATNANIYDQFLATLTLSEFGKLPLSLNIQPYKANDSSYGNSAEMSKGTTTTTAATMLLLAANNQPVPQDVTSWLLEQHIAGAGFRASPSTYMPDLLSTGTALAALRLCNRDTRPIASDCLDFIEGCRTDDGGFAAIPGDSLSDCEYVFYALLGLGCLVG